ncbi:MAG: CapA family protein [Phycisphaeraceae bacterium]|nr:CapA family protein [Phycisphaeraceae bacterium]
MNDSLAITFLGDVACPDGSTPQIQGDAAPRFDFTVVNFEGALAAADPSEPRTPLDKPIALYNSQAVLPILAQWGTRVATLANNHLMDIGRLPSRVAADLNRAGIVACGAGDDLAQAAQPAHVRHQGRDLYFLAFGWDVIQCPHAGSSRPGVNPWKPAHVLDSVRALRRQDPKGIIVVVPHWDYELEIYPMPMDRQLAFDVIDAGADAIVGHHPHCVQGLEWYRGAPIAYSMGNWFLPAGRCFGGRWRFPDYTKPQLALQWRPLEKQVLCHWYHFDDTTNVIHYQRSADARACPKIAELTPFAGLSHPDYVAWFRRHRRKRKALPIYKDYRHSTVNRLYTGWVRLRQRAINSLLKLKLK